MCEYDVGACVQNVCICMCECVTTAVREDDTSVSIPVKMTHLWTGSCLLCVCECVTLGGVT